MRIVGPEVKNAALDLKGASYCFEITLQNEQTLFLTTKGKKFFLNDMLFKPYSGLQLIEGSFNDSAKDHIILEGIYESGGIDKEADLCGARVKIWMEFAATHFHHFVTYYCTIYTKYDLNFSIKLEPEVVKYNQSLLNCFSKTCRANFGDSKCKVDKEVYKFIYNVTEITGRDLTVDGMDKENGYFNGGQVQFNEGGFCAKILSHFRDIIEIDKTVPDALKHYKNITLITGCDKKFITCCNKFDNAVNFRGEPLIPKPNFLRII